MQQITFVFLLLSLNLNLWASTKEDSTAYEKQRERVNKLLQHRSERFGEFDASLQTRTGIFGLKTKKDMQASIDILKQIVTTDNQIFKETKALLDFKDIEKRTVEGKANESSERITGYINTISKLQRNQDTLKQEIMVLEKRNNIYLNLVLFATLGAVILMFRWIKRKKN